MISIRDAASYLPPTRVGTEFFLQHAKKDDTARSHPMFHASTFRHHVCPDESPADMVEKAVRVLAHRHGAQAMRDIDVLITNVALPDVFFTGCGAAVAKRLGCRPEWLIDLHNSGCAAPVHMLRLAQILMQTTTARSALLCNVANLAGRLYTEPTVRTLPEAAIPGDGCGVLYVTPTDDSPLLGVECHHHERFADDMGLTTADGRRYWEPGNTPLHIGFTQNSAFETIRRGKRLVPDAVQHVCQQIGVQVSDIDALITNQPNRTLLRLWREELGLAPEQHLDTFDDYGNLFGAGIPIILDQANQTGQLRDGSLVVLAGFAHAGDFSGAAALRWRIPDAHRSRHADW